MEESNVMNIFTISVETDTAKVQRKVKHEHMWPPEHMVLTEFKEALKSLKEAEKDSSEIQATIDGSSPRDINRTEVSE